MDRMAMISAWVFVWVQINTDVIVGCTCFGTSFGHYYADMTHADQTLSRLDFFEFLVALNPRGQKTEVRTQAETGAGQSRP